ncbi:MAG: signal peptidase II [Clostridia bacterium]
MILILLMAAGVMLVDALSKAWASVLLAQFERVTVLNGLLELRLTHNSGMALGILAGNQVAIILMPLAVITCGAWLLHRYRLTGFTRVACGLVLGGFLGNFLERVMHGYVVDMVFFPFMPWFVCNLADIAICVGVALFGISLLARPQDWREKHAKDHRDGAV